VLAEAAWPAGRPTPEAVQQALGQLVDWLGIVRETTCTRGRIFAYMRYLDALNAEIGTPPGYAAFKVASPRVHQLNPRKYRANRMRPHTDGRQD
jgi:hypothetical protein